MWELSNILRSCWVSNTVHCENIIYYLNMSRKGSMEREEGLFLFLGLVGRGSGQDTHWLYDGVVTVAVVHELLPGHHPVPVQVHLLELTVSLEGGSSTDWWTVGDSPAALFLSGKYYSRAEPSHTPPPEPSQQSNSVLFNTLHHFSSQDITSYLEHLLLLNEPILVQI